MLVEGFLSIVGEGIEERDSTKFEKGLNTLSFHKTLNCRVQRVSSRNEGCCV